MKGDDIGENLFQISPVWDWNGSLGSIYDVKLANGVALDFNEIGLFRGEKRGVAVEMDGFNTPKSL